MKRVGSTVELKNLEATWLETPTVVLFVWLTFGGTATTSWRVLDPSTEMWLPEATGRKRWSWRNSWSKCEGIIHSAGFVPDTRQCDVFGLPVTCITWTWSSVFVVCAACTLLWNFCSRFMWCFLLKKSAWKTMDSRRLQMVATLAWSTCKPTKCFLPQTHSDRQTNSTRWSLCIVPVFCVLGWSSARRNCLKVSWEKTGATWRGSINPYATWTGARLACAATISTSKGSGLIGACAEPCRIAPICKCAEKVFPQYLWNIKLCVSERHNQPCSFRRIAPQSVSHNFRFKATSEKPPRIQMSKRVQLPPIVKTPAPRTTRNPEERQKTVTSTRKP